MYHPARKKLIDFYLSILLIVSITRTEARSFQMTANAKTNDDNLDNNLIDFEEDNTFKFNKKYGITSWHDDEYFNKKTHRYTIVNDIGEKIFESKNKAKNIQNTDATTTEDYRVIPLELITTTENTLISIIESTTEQDLSVIPLSTTERVPNITITDSITLPVSTDYPETTTIEKIEIIEQEKNTAPEISKEVEVDHNNETTKFLFETTSEVTSESDEVNVSTESFDETTLIEQISKENYNNSKALTEIYKSTEDSVINTTEDTNFNVTDINFELLNTTKLEMKKTNESRIEESRETDADVPIFTELDAEEEIDVPEDYYDTKDVVPTTAPRTDALSVIFGLAGSVVESVVETVAERVVPKSVFDLFKRMQRQSEALESERLRSKEENGGIGQFTRGIIKTISTGISRPLSQLMAGARDIGSLDTDRGFVSSLASGVTSVANVANSLVDTFKDRVQAIYPGTVWCGDGRSAAARSGDLGLFFFTDTCCRQHDACKLYIKAGDSKYGLTNTGLFTRSHCSCDVKFRECLRRTNSLVSAQIGLTYFNVLGPQCFRRAHPIVRCARRTRITGQRCEEYELDFTKPRMWQWFDNETF